MRPIHDITRFSLIALPFGKFKVIRLNFTLIELLVTVATIAILVSLILPALVRAKDKVYQLRCITNLRQIGIASTLYADDYDDFVLPGKFDDTTIGGYNHWINYLYAESIREKRVFLCPSLSAEDWFNPAGGDNQVTEAGYIMNLIEPGDANWNGAVINGDTEQCSGWGTTSRPLRLSKVLNPQSKIHVTDVIGGGISNNHSGVTMFKRTDHGLLAYPPFGLVRWVGLIHNFGFNALMGDTHVEWMIASGHNQWAVNAP